VFLVRDGAPFENIDTFARLAGWRYASVQAALRSFPWC
jgi:hypothetical protein